jgi:signal transduction histidine kinase
MPAPTGKSTSWLRWRPYARPLLALAALLALAGFGLYQPIRVWLLGEGRYDAAAMREWIEEARVFSDTLPEMARAYLQALDKAGDVDPERDPELLLQAGAIEENLRSLGDPPSKMYPGQLPLFPIIYRMVLVFDRAGKQPDVIAWDSELPRYPTQFQTLLHDFDPRIHMTVQYQVHAYNRRQHDEQVAARRFRWIASMAAGGLLLAGIWIYLVQRQERERRNAEVSARTMLEEAKQRGLEEELRRREAEQKQEQTQRQLLEQQLAREEAERQAWELKSSLFANIGIMAGSYAHNIKNLLVRPNDLLHRCLESDELSGDQSRMIEEVRHTLGTVTQRLQEILRTVNRDHSKSEPVRLDLNRVAGELGNTWHDLARARWKLQVDVSLASDALWIEMDASGLQQSLENLLFNARDAVAEMRGFRQARVRQNAKLSSTERKAALIAAAGWVGNVVFRTYHQDRWAVLEVQDDGVGMADDVRLRCTEAHFTTKRNNALFEGNATGMGLGLSFVAAILKIHGATLEIESQPLQGALFRVRFPLATAAAIRP